MDALIRWMIALSWTAAGMSFSMVAYYHNVLWHSHHRVVALDENERIEEIAKENNWKTTIFDPKISKWEHASEREKVYAMKYEPYRTAGFRIWQAATLLFTLNAIGLIVIHKKGFNPATTAAVTQTLSPPSP
jgi:hypothetical protein